MLRECCPEIPLLVEKGTKPGSHANEKLAHEELKSGDEAIEDADGEE